MMTGVRAREYLPSEIAVLISVVLHTLAFLSWEQREWLARLPLFRPVAKALRAPASTENPLVPVITFVEAPPAAPSTGSRREIAAIKSLMTAVGAGRVGIAAFNVAGSPFGEYDKALIRAVQSRWYALIEQNGLYERAGTVMLHFDLMSDGSVKNMELKENTAGQILELFCEKAVVDSAPFAPLPENLQVLIGSD